MMIRVEIVANHSVEENIFEAFAKEQVAKYYTKFSNVLGVGSAGPRMGDAIWPEENFSLVIWCEPEEALGIKRAVVKVKEQFPGEGVKFFSLPEIRERSASTVGRPEGSATQPASAAERPASPAARPASAAVQPASPAARPASAAGQPASAARPASAAGQPVSVAARPAGSAAQPVSAAERPASAAAQPAAAPAGPAGLAARAASKMPQPAGPAAQFDAADKGGKVTEAAAPVKGESGTP
ncbi:MAG: hypothetical protein LBG57_02055 [Treponema sp.]|jgi:hypothetical protein|nr:hypothetical protein [Treponema sp.]